MLNESCLNIVKYNACVRLCLLLVYSLLFLWFISGKIKLYEVRDPIRQTDKYRILTLLKQVNI